MRITKIKDVVLTRYVTMTGSDVAIVVPRGANVVNIKCASEVTFKENESGTYTEDGITYGTGYPGTNMDFPVDDSRKFLLNGTNGAVVTLLFSSIREV